MKHKNLKPRGYARTSRRLCCALSLGALPLIATTNTQAAIRTWDGGANGDNWSGNGGNGNNNWDGNNSAVAANDDLIFSGTVRLTPNNNTAADTSYASITFNNTAGAFTLGGNRITLGGNVTNNDTDLQTINMDLILSGTRTFDAAAGNLAVGGVISGSNGLTKTGSNLLLLTNANLHTGTTLVNAGTLLANNTTGSATGTGAVSVGASGKLGGTGTIAPTGSNGINVTGVLAPGGSVGTGTLTINLGSTTGTVVMNNATNFQYELGLAGASIGSFGTSDLLSIAGAAASDFAFNNNSIDFLGTGAIGYYKLFDTSSNNADTWTGLTFNSTTGLVSSGLTYSNLAGSLTGNFIVGTVGNGGTTGDIYFQVVPEPTAALLGGLGVLTLLRRRRSA